MGLKNIVPRILLLMMLMTLISCSTSRYSMEHDVGPEGDFDASQVPDAVPVWEPLSPGGNRSPYRVRGKEYHLLDRAKGYSEKGVASWYGLKFHGELTSNGEVYNMYEMSAAHKTLPLPSYLRVTNLHNQRSVVVRVNDRGPFHSGRIIDLSYAAAKKLGFADKGTANVKLEAIAVKQLREGEVVVGQDRLAIFVQVGAFSKESAAEALKNKAGQFVEGIETFVSLAPDRNSPLYRVRIGPIPDVASANGIVSRLKKAGVGRAMVITRSMRAKGH